MLLRGRRARELELERLVADGDGRLERFDRPKATVFVGFTRDEHVGEKAELLEALGVKGGVGRSKFGERRREERRTGRGHERRSQRLVRGAGFAEEPRQALDVRSRGRLLLASARGSGAGARTWGTGRRDRSRVTRELAEVRARDGVALTRFGAASREREEAPGVARGDVTLGRAPVVAFRARVGFEHFVRGEHGVEPAVVVDVLGARDRTALEDAAEELVMVAVERDERRDEGVEAARVARDQPKFFPLFARVRVERLFDELELFFVVAELEAEPVHVDDEHEARHRENHEIDRQLAKPLHHGRLARFEQHLEPEREAGRIEARILADSGLLPEILVEHARELLGAGERDELAGALEADRVDEPSEDGRRELADGGDECRAFEHVAKEPCRGGSAVAFELRHAENTRQVGPKWELGSAASSCYASVQWVGLVASVPVSGLSRSTPFAFVLLTTLVAGRARAQAGENQGAAQALYDEARKLASAKDFAAACPKFKASYDMDPAGGTLLNLADCYENEGKTALAWTTFKDALVAAQQDGNQPRVEFAKAHIASLEQSLAYLTLDVPNDARLDGLVVSIDGAPLASAAWGVALPVDPGKHVVRAEAKGHEPFERSFEVSKAGQREAVSVPLLAASGGADASGAPKPVGGGHTVRTIGWITGGAGVVVLGVGGYFGLKAFSDWGDRNDACKGGCTPEAKAAGSRASDAATLSTVLFAVGVGAVGVGAGLILTSGSGEQTKAAAPRTFEAGVVPTPGGAIIDMRQTW